MYPKLFSRLKLPNKIFYAIPISVMPPPRRPTNFPSFEHLQHPAKSQTCDTTLYVVFAHYSCTYVFHRSRKYFRRYSVFCYVQLPTCTDRDTTIASKRKKKLWMLISVFESSLGYELTTPIHIHGQSSE